MADDRSAPRYSRQEVEEILRRAAERTHEGGDHFAHEELVAAAREAGIDVGALESVALERSIEREDRRAIEVWDGRRKRRFASHLITYLIVHAGFFAMNLLTGGSWWVLWPLVSWGMLVALHAARSLRAPSPEQIEKITRRERRRREAERKRQQRRLARDQARMVPSPARPARTHAARHFEQAVENGVNALMGALAKRLEQAAGPRTALPDTDLNRYIARQKQRARTRSPGQGDEGAGEDRAEPLITPPPHVRVEVQQDEPLEADVATDQRRRRR